MSEQFTIVPNTGKSKYVSLGRTKSGRLFRKQILQKGDLRHPSTGEIIDVNEAFMSRIVENFEGNVADIVQFPLADKDNAHTEDPTANIGEVVGLSVEDDGLYATIDVRKHGDDVGSTILGASAFLHLNYTDTRTGKAVGPTLLHVAATNRPYVTELGNYEEIIAASNSVDASQGVVVLSSITKERPMDLKEITEILQNEHKIDLGALIAGQEGAAQAQTDAATAATAALTADVTKALEGAGIKLSAPAAASSGGDVVTAALETLLSANSVQQTRIETLELSAHSGVVDKLIGEGKILPAQRDAMIVLSSKSPKLFEQLVPTESIVKLGNENGASVTDASTAILNESDLDADLARLTAENPDVFGVTTNG